MFGNHSIDALRSNQSKGQIVIMTAAVIAFSVVSLVLVLNSALFIENLESQPLPDSGDTVTEYQSVAYQSGNELVYRINQKDTRSPTREARNEFKRASDLLYIQSSDSTSTFIEYSNTRATRGTGLKQSSDHKFQSADDKSDWTLATNADSVRRFRLNVDEDELGRVRSSRKSALMKTFRVEVRGSNGNTWNAVIREEGEQIAITIFDGDGDPVTHRYATESTYIGLTTGTVGGNEDQFEFASNVERPYDIRIRNGGQAYGSYTLTVPEDSAVRSNFNGGTKDPYMTNAVYSLTTTLTVDSETTEVSSPITVAPCLPRADSCTVGEGILKDNRGTSSTGGGGGVVTPQSDPRAAGAAISNEIPAFERQGDTL